MAPGFTPQDITDLALKIYDSTVISKIPLLGSAIDLAEDYWKKGRDIPSCVDRLIRWQCSKTGIAGALAGLPGFLAAPATIPADIAQSIYVHVRMVGAIAHIYGHDLHSDPIKTLVLACLAGNGVHNVIKNAGVEIGKNVAVQAIKQISGKTLKEINKQVGFKLFTKFGSKGVINLGKVVPFIGAIIGGAANSASTYIVGKTAKNVLKP